jgi:hypothetical protein
MITMEVNELLAVIRTKKGKAVKARRVVPISLIIKSFEWVRFLYN